MEKKIAEVKNFEKSYGERKVVEHLNFSVSKGEIVGLLGPNGAGKSTTIRMMTGIESCDNGEMYFNGKEVEKSRNSIKKEIGIVPQDIAVYGDMSTYDNVKFFCSLYGFHGKELEERVKESLEFVGLWNRRKDKPGKFSGGMKRRLNIACSIAHSPKLLIMDEPTVGIDPQSRNYILEAIRILQKRGTTVIYVSHYMEEIEAICDRILIMDHGCIKIDEKKETLKDKYREEGVQTLEDIFLKVTGVNLRDEEEE